MRRAFATVALAALLALVLPASTVQPGSPPVTSAAAPARLCPTPSGCDYGPGARPSTVAEHAPSGSAAAADATVGVIVPAPPPSRPTCTASWYGEELRGAITASGVPFDPDAYTAAMWDVPFGTEVLVVHAASGRTVAVTVTDRGPARRLRRCIDLSRTAFAALTDLDVGTTDVEVHLATEGPHYEHQHFDTASAR